ncbi:MAG: caspase family protein [Verrucomicrobiae bacterium]|nr:caspase family protein [Verrucomicrobiae bacterium]
MTEQNMQTRSDKPHKPVQGCTVCGQWEAVVADDAQTGHASMRVAPEHATVTANSRMPTGPPPVVKLAYCFGLNFVNPRNFGGWVGALRGAVNDATDLAALAARLGYVAHTRCNAEASTGAFWRVLDEARYLRAGDKLLLAFSGHGATVPGAEPDGKNEALVLYDGLALDSYLNQALTQLDSGVEVVVVLDCCFAGGLGPAEKRLKGWREKFAPPEVVRPTTPKLRPCAGISGGLAASVLWLMATSEGEPAIDANENGAWTAALLEAFDKLAPAGGPAPTWGDVAAAAAAICAEKYGQKPCYTSAGPVNLLNKTVIA